VLVGFVHENLRFIVLQRLPQEDIMLKPFK
jgi:hypothetical protein